MHCSNYCRLASSKQWRDYYDVLEIALNSPGIKNNVNLFRSLSHNPDQHVGKLFDLIIITLSFSRTCFNQILRSAIERFSG
jgi:hypothetical protein